MADRKAIVKNADMSEEMQCEAIERATEALDQFNLERDIASYIKKEFDKKFNPTWHCIVGRNFGVASSRPISIDRRFPVGQIAVLLFKSG